MRKIKFLDRGQHQGLCYTTVEIVYNATSNKFKEYQGRFNIRYSATLLLKLFIMQHLISSRNIKVGLTLGTLLHYSIEIVYNATSNKFKEYQGRFNIRDSATLLLKLFIMQHLISSRNIKVGLTSGTLLHYY